jgi:hypothetical protein
MGNCHAGYPKGISLRLGSNANRPIAKSPVTHVMHPVSPWFVERISPVLT